jgi:hypothetical protein
MVEADRNCQEQEEVPPVQAIDHQTVDQDACQDGDTAHIDILMGSAPPGALQADPERSREEHEEEERGEEAVLDRNPNIQVVGRLRKEDLALTRTNSKRRVGERDKRHGLRGESFTIVVL